MIKQIILWSNGQVMAFGPNGAQLPEYQGQLCDVQQAILAAGPETRWSIGAWHEGTLPMTREAFAAWRFGPGPPAPGASYGDAAPVLVLPALPPCFTCPQCGRTSYDLDDVAQQSCGACHQRVE